jgi:hypothetical protein
LKSCLERAQKELGRLNATEIRNLGTQYVTALTHTVSRIVDGSSEAITSVNGQTLKEETDAQGEPERAAIATSLN